MSKIKILGAKIKLFLHKIGCRSRKKEYDLIIEYLWLKKTSFFQKFQSLRKIFEPLFKEFVSFIHKFCTKLDFD